MSLALVAAALLSAAPTPEVAAGLAPKTVEEKQNKGVSLEFGEHGVVGHGVVFSFEPTARLVVDAGVGAFALEGGGWKSGVQARFRLLSTELTPFVGLGVGAGWSSGGPMTRHIYGEGTVSYDFHWLLTARAVAGVEWLHSSGLTFRLAMNYELPLRSDLQILASDSQTLTQSVRSTYGSGLGFSVAVGWRF